jgi:alpha-L-rhamnosidase
VGMIYFGAEKTSRRYQGEDEILNRIFHAAVETYRQNTFTIYMDCPSRERAGWLCDSFFTSRVEKTLTGKSEVERCFLENFFLPDRFENLPEGMFPMCYPADFASGNFIPNWAMFLVLELEEYLERTGDEEFIRNAKDKIYALMNYFKKFENADGLLEKLEKWVFVEWSESNKLTQDINFPTNMLYVKTLRAAARLYHDAEFAEKAERLKMVINEKSFTDKGFYCDNAVYGEDGVARLSGKCTETCQYYAFFCGIATPEEKPELWQRMLHDFGPERIVPNKWPEFTPEAKWKEIYPSNAFIGNYLRLELLYLYGEHEKLIQNIKGFFTKMADLTGTLWENDSTTASCNHGFASHVVYWMDGMGMISE